MKILAVHPSGLMYTKIFLRLEPLGLEIVAGTARRAGHEVELIDLQVETHTDFFRTVRSFQPEVIAFSCNYLANVPEVVDLARSTKELLPGCFVFVGGHSASFTASDILEHGEGAIAPRPQRRLSRPGAEISFADVIRVVDGPLALAPCASRTAYRPCESCVDGHEVRASARRMRSRPTLPPPVGPGTHRSHGRRRPDDPVAQPPDRPGHRRRDRPW